MVIENNIKKILVILILFILNSCDLAWDSINIKNNSKYIVVSIKDKSSHYVYHLNDISSTTFIFSDYAYIDTAKYNIGDTLIFKIKRVN